ncbi:glycosyltransferase family 4 protein [Microbacterium indicum]|uniref:glycosyltransferase family 4 protein n=1 Tax=Microbacterium indicum TaxID=358100 RepID=UPI001FE13B45|nr:glycosyltransferase family 4 protein [Microbacterium indicum]
MRVALVCDYSLDYLGGAQAAFLDQAQILRDAGHRVTIVAPGETSAGRFGVRAPFALPGVDLPWIRSTDRLRARLRALYAVQGIEVVHAHSEFGMSAAAVQVAREMGIPVVQTVHTFFWRGPRLGPLDAVAAAAIRGVGRLLRGSATSRARLGGARVGSALRGITLSACLAADAVISPSAHQAERLIAAGAHGVVAIPNALPESGEAGEPLAAVDGPLRIAWVGRLVPEKRILEFLDAARQAMWEVPGGLEVAVVGDGPLLAEARRRAEGEEGIRFTGRVDRDRVAAEMRDAHLVALTSLGFDNQPVIVVEAFRQARSVFYVDSALREGLAEAGVLADSPDVSGMAASLARLAREPRVAVERSRAASEAAEVFSPAAHERAVTAVYRGVIA